MKKIVNVAPLIGVLAYMTVVMLPRQVSASADSTMVSQLEDTAGIFPAMPVFTDIVVGEFNNLSGPDTFLPHQTCKVSNANNVLKLLQECKNQRKGWLKL